MSAVEALRLARHSCAARRAVCCGIGHDHVVHCWGKPPRLWRSHAAGGINERNALSSCPWAPLSSRESNLTVFHVHNRRCVSRAYLATWVAAAPRHARMCPRRRHHQFELSIQLLRCATSTNLTCLSTRTWLGANLSNVGALARALVARDDAPLLRWRPMLMTSCFNFTQPFPSLHCAALPRFVNRTVEVVKAPPKPFTIERLTANDVMATKYTLAHTVQPDHYCFEKLASH